MSTTIAIGASTLQLPIPGENYDVAVINTNNQHIATEVNATNTRQTNIKHAEFTGGSIPYPSSAAQWGVGTLAVDTASTPNVTYNNSFVSYAGQPDTLKISEAGIYLFQWFMSATSLPPNGEVAIKNTVTGNYILNDDLANGVSYSVPVIGTAYCSVNDIISFFTFNRAGAFTATSRIKVTKLQG